MQKRRIIVTCALITDGPKVLAARRGAAMRHPGKWEFPGGKLEPGEDPLDCIQREIKEELGIEVVVTGDLTPNQHSYPDLDLVLLPFTCSWISGELLLGEHDLAEWFTTAELAELDWAEADLPVVREWVDLVTAGDWPKTN